MVIKLVRNHLRYYFDTKRRRLPLPGARHFVALFREFKRDLPKLAKTALLAPREINSVDGGYLDFLEMLKEFTNIMRRAGKIA